MAMTKRRCSWLPSSGARGRKKGEGGELAVAVVTFGLEPPLHRRANSAADASEAEEIDVESLLESLEKKEVLSSSMPKCIASKSNLRISADGIGSISGRLLLGTAEIIPSEELIDTTGAGDAFIGAVLYAFVSGPSKFGSVKSVVVNLAVAACGCRGLGARTALPHRTDPRLVAY
ncbi:hypothetical protein OsI_30328 [Oryza sativa Indica Group]|uniref:Carbohydrate kinase PfkB domain-containing protein n=1 Tax=Oryza sativa subsp. indica TaxID=39946 RepID=A2YYA2_ORYSI|nr:hypothetical protein OsI_30328 [Oryza sativa Indica Group]